MQALRGQLGTAVDRVFYRNERLIIQRGGKPKAVLVPLQDYEQLKRIREKAWDDIFTFNQEASRNAAQSDLSEQELEETINEAITEVRAEMRAERDAAQL
jgi:prevent-host-death family protein